MNNELLEIYLQFNSKNYNYLSQLDKENLVKVLILNICQSNDLKVPEIYFNKEESGVDGSFHCEDEPFINIYIEPGMTPYHLLKTIIHETYHYQQYEYNKTKDNEIIKGLQNPIDYDPLYFLQQHEIEAREYTLNQLKEAAKIINDELFNIEMKQDEVNDSLQLENCQNKASLGFLNKLPIKNEKLQSVIVKTNQNIINNKIEKERQELINYSKLISQYLDPFVKGKYEYYNIDIDDFKINIKLSNDKSIFNITDNNNKTITVIAERNRANLFFSGYKQNDKINNLDKIYSLVGNLVQLHNFENNTTIANITCVPFVYGLNKTKSEHFINNNSIKDFSLYDINIDNNQFDTIQHKISEQYLNNLINHKISEEISFYATNNNFIIDKITNRLYFYNKEQLELNCNADEAIKLIQEELLQNVVETSTYFNINNLSQILCNNVLKDLSLDDKINFNKKLNNIYYNKNQQIQNNISNNKMTNIKETR